MPCSVRLSCGLGVTFVLGYLASAVELGGEGLRGNLPLVALSYLAAGIFDWHDVLACWCWRAWGLFGHGRMMRDAVSL